MPVPSHSRQQICLILLYGLLVLILLTIFPPWVSQLADGSTMAISTRDCLFNANPVHRPDYGRLALEWFITTAGTLAGVLAIQVAEGLRQSSAAVMPKAGTGTTDPTPSGGLNWPQTIVLNLAIIFTSAMACHQILASRGLSFWPETLYIAWDVLPTTVLIFLPQVVVSIWGKSRLSKVYPGTIFIAIWACSTVIGTASDAWMREPSMVWLVGSIGIAMLRHLNNTLTTHP